MIALPPLYPHQETLRDATRAALAKYRRVILTAPPGMGKTRCAKWILGASANRKPPETASGRSLFAVHRRGLVENATDSFCEEPELRHGVIMSGEETAYGSKIQVASIDTMLSWFVDDDQYTTDITFDLVVIDECVSGDAIVDTELGRMRLDQIPDQRPNMVRTYSEEQGYHFARIRNWMYKGERDTIEVHTHHGKVRCTPDHEIYTRRGWLQAQFLSPTDEILVCADAGESLAPDVSMHGGVKPDQQQNSLCQCGGIFTSPGHFAHADAGSGLGPAIETSMLGSGTSTYPDTTNTLTAVRIVRATSRLNSRTLKGRRFSERFSAIHQLDTRTRTPSPHGFTALTATSRGSGQNTRRRSFIDSTPARILRKTTDGEIGQFACLRGAIQLLRRFTTSLLRGGRNGCLGDGLTGLAMLASHGGCVTTDQRQAGRRLSSTLTDFLSVKTKLSRNGSAIIWERQPSATTVKRRCISSTSPVGRKSKSASESPNTSQNVCGTSWSRVMKIVHARPTAVYDIEVEGSHCFFANNLLVHNCHSHHSKFARFLKYHDAKREELGLHPAYVIGLTATPQAKGLADVYKDIVLGPSTQWLVENKFLSPFRYFRATQGKLGLLVKRGREFTKDSEAAAMDGLAGDLVRDWKQFAEGRPTVGFFPRRSHAKDATVQLEAAGLRVAYVDGETSDELRRSIFRRLNNHELDYLCNVQVVERGTDIPRIGCVQLCVAVGSVVRYRQMIGRGSRVHPNKSDCLILDHGGNVARHGFFEDDPAWSLDISSKDPGEQGTRPTIECPKCQAIYRGGLCKSCGYEPTPKERRSQGLEFDGSELVEVTAKEKERPKAKSAEELMISALYRAGKSGRTWKQCVGIFYKMREEQGSNYRVPKSVTIAGHRYEMIRYGSDDSGRKVSMLYPFTVGKHGGEYLVRETETIGTAW